MQKIRGRGGFREFIGSDIHAGGFVDLDVRPSTSVLETKMAVRTVRS
jgi:hypothetical protein